MYTHKHTLCTYIFIGRWAALVTDQQSDSDCFAATGAKTKSVSDSAKRETSLCMNQVLDAERSELVCEILWRNS